MVSEGKNSLKDQGDGISIHLSKCFSPSQDFIAVKKYTEVMATFTKENI